MGIFPLRSIATLAASLSTQMTSLPVSAKQAPTTKPTYSVPITAIFIRAPAPVDYTDIPRHSERPVPVFGTMPEFLPVAGKIADAEPKKTPHGIICLEKLSID